MVGESAPGSNLHILSIDFVSAFSITYLLSAALITPSNLLIKSRMLLSFIFTYELDAISTASEFSRVLNSVKLFASSVAPDETRSQIQSAIPIYGVSSTEPLILITSALIFLAFRIFFTKPG